MAVAQIYRSVKLVLQNSTNDTFTVQGFAAPCGTWADKQAPVQGMLVGEQSAMEWTSISAVLGTGTAAYVRFGCSFGYFMIRWSLPWTGRFDHGVDPTPGLRIDVTVDRDHPDAIVLVAIVTATGGVLERRE